VPAPACLSEAGGRGIPELSPMQAIAAQRLVNDTDRLAITQRSCIGRRTGRTPGIGLAHGAKLSNQLLKKGWIIGGNTPPTGKEQRFSSTAT